jgi:hypothetical protein
MSQNSVVILAKGAAPPSARARIHIVTVSGKEGTQLPY